MSTVSFCDYPILYLISYLDSRYKQRQLLDFILEILSIHHPRKVKHFGTFINFRPEAVFEQFFGLAQVLGGAKLIEMRKDAHDLWESMSLQDIEEFKGFHFKAKLGVDAQAGPDRQSWHNPTWQQYHWGIPKV